MPVETPAPPATLIETLQSNWSAEMTGFYTYSHLAEAEKDQARRRTLRSLAMAEKHHADLWADRLHALGGDVPAVDASVLAGPRLKSIADDPETLRTLELDESRDIARYGQQLKSFGDQPSLTVLTEVLSDEQAHYKTLQGLTKKKTPDPEADTARANAALTALLDQRETGKVKAGSWIGDAVYGINDGLGSIFGIVSGVSGATLGDSHFVLIAGLAGMVASALSMGSGAFLAAKSQREIYEAEYAREESAVKLNPVEARELLSLTYQVRGLPQQDADNIVEHLAIDDKRFVQALARERLHTSEEGLSQPWTSAISGALSTAVGAFIPIIPFFFTTGIHAIVLAAIISLIAHFAVGAAKALVTIRPWWASGFEMTWIGALEGAVTYAIGIGLGHLGH